MRMRRIVVLAASVLTLLATSPAGASSAAPTWPVAQSLPLPSGASGLNQGYLPGLSCPSAGNCTAAGAFLDVNGATQGLLISESAGSWGSPVELALPSNAGTDPLATFNGLSCPSVGNCAAVGTYQDSTGDGQSFVVDEASSSWATATQITLPSNALSSGQNSQIKAVSCKSAGNCSAVGTYLDQTKPIAKVEGFTLNEVGGKWGVAVAIKLPANANFNPFVALSQIECSSVANCTAVGSYIDAENVTRPLLVSEVNGSWSPAKALSLPNNANAYPLASLSEMTCLASGDCVAIGTYTSNSGAIEGMITTESSGIWGRAVAMSMPPNAAANPHVFFYGFNGISCASIGSCSAGGQYRDRSGNYQGFLIDSTNGTWRPASELVLPSGALYAGRNGGVVAVSCSSAGNCSAGAAYLDGTGNYQAFIVNEVNNTWQAGTKIVLPSGATAVGTGGGIYGLVCSSSGACTATGSYLDSTGNYQGLSLTSR